MAQLATRSAGLLAAVEPRCPGLREEPGVDVPHRRQEEDVGLVALVGVDVLDVILAEDRQEGVREDLLALGAVVRLQSGLDEVLPHGMWQGRVEGLAEEAVEAVGEADEGAVERTQTAVLHDSLLAAGRGAQRDASLCRQQARKLDGEELVAVALGRERFEAALVAALRDDFIDCKLTCQHGFGRHELIDLCADLCVDGMCLVHELGDSTGEAVGELPQLIGEQLAIHAVALLQPLLVLDSDRGEEAAALADLEPTEVGQEDLVEEGVAVGGPVLP